VVGDENQLLELSAKRWFECLTEGFFGFFQKRVAGRWAGELLIKVPARTKLDKNSFKIIILEGGFEINEYLLEFFNVK
jgi:hypothetical protein